MEFGADHFPELVGIPKEVFGFYLLSLLSLRTFQIPLT